MSSTACSTRARVTGRFSSARIRPASSLVAVEVLAAAVALDHDQPCALRALIGGEPIGARPRTPGDGGWCSRSRSRESMTRVPSAAAWTSQVLRLPGGLHKRWYGRRIPQDMAPIGQPQAAPGSVASMARSHRGSTWRHRPVMPTKRRTPKMLGRSPASWPGAHQRPICAAPRPGVGPAPRPAWGSDARSRSSAGRRSRAHLVLNTPPVSTTSTSRLATRKRRHGDCHHGQLIGQPVEQMLARRGRPRERPQTRAVSAPRADACSIRPS